MGSPQAEHNETKVALLEVKMDGAGRLSKCSDDEYWVRSWEPLPGVLGRLEEAKAGDGETKVEEWFKSSLRECFGKEVSDWDLM
jgi:hypothetical protein